MGQHISFKWIDCCKIKKKKKTSAKTAKINVLIIISLYIYVKQEQVLEKRDVKSDNGKTGLNIVCNVHLDH